MNRALVITILAVVLAGLIGVGAYQAGVAQGLATSGQVTGPVAAPYYYHPGFFGFAFLGILFPILFFFLIFGLVRAAFWGGPQMGRWRGGPWMDRRTMLEEWHRQAHTSEQGSERRPDLGTDRRAT